MYKQKNDYEYACMLSHLDTINMFSKTNYNVALIMEDDLTMELRPYWRKSIKEVIDGAPKDWEIIQLCYNTQANIKNFSLYERNVRNKTVCAAAYLISNQAAKRLIGEIYSDNKYNLEHYIIHHADCYIFNKLITYTYKYPYFIYKTNNNSLLHPEDLNSHERSKRQVLEMFKGLSNKNIS
jgi:GR25 family glycosyltransferase involved in LPS biosynthesis